MRVLAAVALMALAALGLSLLTASGGAPRVSSAPAFPALHAPPPLAPLGSPAPATAQAARDAHVRLPLGFVENAGQSDRRVRYEARGPGFGVYFTRDEIVLALKKGARGGVALALAFEGANPNARLTVASALPGRVNHLIGADAAGWQTGLRRYAELRYRSLWPGIDLVVRGRRGRLKYEFRLAPGADPDRIRLAYRGVERLRLGAGGSLLVETALGRLRDARPVSYQRVGGRRVPVASRFRLDRRHANGYGFALGGGYDPGRPLVIDPTLAYSTFLGGTGTDGAADVAVDAGGSAYVTGSTDSADFPTTLGAFDTEANGAGDAFVSKLDPTGSALVYSTYLGGAGVGSLGFDGGRDIAVDASGGAYVVGTTESNDFPTTAGAYDRSFNGGDRDAFVVKLHPSGSALVYSTYLGGGPPQGVVDFEDARDIAVDPAGNAYVTGTTSSSDFPTTGGAHDRTLGGLTDAFVSKLGPSGSSLSYSTFLGGAADGGADQGLGITVDTGGSAYVTGETSASDFPTTSGAYDPSYNGADAFVTKVSPSGSALAYSTFLGGAMSVGGASDSGSGIAVDGGGSAYVTGTTGSADFPTTAGAYDRTFDGGSVNVVDAFVSRLDPAGSVLSYSTYLGGAEDDFGAEVAVGGGGAAHVTGTTSSSDFPTTPGAYDTSYNGGTADAYVTSLNAAGAALSHSTYLGGGRGDFAGGIALSAAGAVYVAGATLSSDFPTTPGAFDTTFNDGPQAANPLDAFVAKFAPEDAVLSVTIDVKPGDAANQLNLRSRGVIPVAVLTTAAFDARSVDVRTVCFGDAENAAQRACSEAHGRGHLEDVDRDGDLDLVLHFRTQQTGIDQGDASACLSGATRDGRRIEGCDSIRTT